MIIDQQLKAYYEKAGYQLLSPSIRLMPNHYSEALNTLLIDNNAGTWALITAFNPNSKLLDNEVNNSNQEKLKIWLEQNNFSWLPAMNQDLIGNWPDEPSCMILDMNKEQAIDLGNEFHQKAILLGRLGGQVNLLML